MFNENWNNEVTKSYLNLYNEDGTVANAPVFNKVEETVVEPVQLVENPETEEVIEEETTEEGDFLFSLIEDVQNSIGEELTEQEMQVIFETVAIVVEGMVKKMSVEKEKKKAAKDEVLAKKYRKSYEDALKVTNSRTDDNGKPLNPYDNNDS